MKHGNTLETSGKEDNYLDFYLDFISGTSGELNDFPADGDIYAFIAENLALIAPEDTIIIVNSLDHETNTITLRSIVGLGSRQYDIEAILGQPLKGLSFQIPDSVITSMLTGECIEIRGGLKELSSGWIPDSVCKQIEVKPYFGTIYSAGISWKGKLNGGVTFILPPGAQLENRDLVTFFIHQAAGYLQQRKSEEKAEKNAELYRTLAESAQDQIIIGDVTGRIHYINTTAAAFIGLLPEEIIGKNPDEYIDSQFCREMERLLSECLNTKKTITKDLSFPHPGGKIDLNTQVIPLIEESGVVRQFMVVARDITARKKAEEALRESENKFVTVFQNTPNPLSLVAGGVFVDVNPAFLRDSGYAREDVIGKTPEMVAIFSDENDHSRFVSAIRDQGHIEGMEIRTRKKSGEIRDCLFSSCIVMIHGKPHTLSTTQDITELKKAEEALKESQNRLQLALGASEVGIFTWDLLKDERHVITGGPLFGYTKDELEEHFRSYEKNSYPGDSMNVGDIRENHDVNGQPVISEFERRIRGKDGTWQWMLIRGSVVSRDPAQNPLVLMGTFRDVTRSKESEILLKESENRYRSFVEKFKGIAYQAAAVTWTPIFFHGAVEEITGYTEQELIKGEPRWDQVIHPDDLQEIQVRDTENLLNIPGYHVLREYRIIRKDGEIRWLSDFIQNQIGEDGVVLLSGILTDITDRKTIETALKEKSEELDLFFRVAPDMFCMADTDGYFHMLNKSWETTLGYTIDELKAHQFLDFVHPDDQESTIAAINTLNDQRLVLNFVNRYRCRDGTYRWIEWRSYPYGRMIFASARDITERKQVENALRKANRQVSLLSSVTRHDILNQVTLILGYLSLARDQSVDPLLNEYLDKLERPTQTIQRQIEFTRVYQDIGTYEPLWQKLADLMPDESVPQGIVLNAEVQNTSVFADPMINKVFFNLLDNSLRHGQHVTTIRVSLRESEEGLTIIWEDNGVGIPPEEKEKIFERGYGKNTGLGLFLAREILAITNMTIQETGEQGTGARFEIAVPKGGYRFSDES